MAVPGCDKAGTEWRPIISEKLTKMGVENKIIYDGTIDGCNNTDTAFIVADTTADARHERRVNAIIAKENEPLI